MRVIHSFLMASLSLVAASAAQAAVLIPIVPVSGSSVTTAYAINDKNVIAGSYIDSSGVEHCFFGTVVGSYTTFDGGTGGSQAHGIDNSGTIVGFSGSQSSLFTSQVPFERSPDGTVVDMTIDGQPLYGEVSNIASKGGMFAGTRWEATNFGGEAAAYVGRDGKWTSDVTISAEHQASGAGGINKAGATVGQYFQPPIHGYIVQGSNLTKVDYPSAQGTSLDDINDKGEAVGQWVDANGHTHSFEYDSSTATFIDINVKGAKDVEAWSINAKGVVALSSSKGSFLWCARKKSCPTGGTEVTAETHTGRAR